MAWAFRFLGHSDAPTRGVAFQRCSRMDGDHAHGPGGHRADRTIRGDPARATPVRHAARPDRRGVGSVMQASCGSLCAAPVVRRS